MTFLAGGMSLVSQKPAGKPLAADGGGVAGAVGWVDGTTLGDAVWPPVLDPQPTRTIPVVSNAPIEILEIESIRVICACLFGAVEEDRQVTSLCDAARYAGTMSPWSPA